VPQWLLDHSKSVLDPITRVVCVRALSQECLEGMHAAYKGGGDITSAGIVLALRDSDLAFGVYGLGDITFAGIVLALRRACSRSPITTLL